MLLLLFSVTANAENKTKKPISVKEKKAHFTSVVVPAVKEVYNELDKQYNEISNNLDNKDYAKKIKKLKTKYKVKTDKELLRALKPHPKSIAIAQAAMESAWITSRFFREANNLFGVWSFNKNEPRIAAQQKRGDKTIWVKKYSDVKSSIRDYYETLARSNAYKEFRKLKMKTDNPYKLVKKLDNYSEMGKEYGEKLSSMIKYNKFYLYDR